MSNLEYKVWNKLNYDCLQEVFNFLNEKDLQNAAVVCRSWYEVAMSVQVSRGPICIKRKRGETEPPFRWNFLKLDMISSCHIPTAFNIFFITAAFGEEDSKRCHCQYLPRNVYSVVVHKYFVAEDMNSIVGLFFPEIQDMVISTLTLSTNYSLNGTYCKELNSMIDDSFSENEQLKNIFKPYFELRFPTESFIIWLTNGAGSFFYRELETCLLNWFMNTQVAIWGGVVNDISVCNHDHIEHEKKYDSKSVCILIRGSNIDVKSFYLDEVDKISRKFNYKLRIIKETMKSRKKSIGFMYTSIDQFQLGDFESRVFQENFPMMPFIKITGHEAYHHFRTAKRLDHIFNTKKTMFMIISYD